MSKIIFLDVDGVLNRNDKEYNTLEKSPTGFVGVDQKYVLQLKRIVDATGAEIILTSDWKDCFDTADCNPEFADADGQYLWHRLADNGIIIKEKTDDSSVGILWYSRRGEGIRKYLNEHPEVTNYVILDDVKFVDFTDELEEHLILLKAALSNNAVEKIIGMLRR